MKLLRVLRFLKYAELIVKTAIPLIEKMINKDLDGDGHVGAPN